MYPVSNTVKALFDAEAKQVLRITGTDRNGATISITDANLLIGSFNVDRYSCNGQKLEIGTAIASELNLKLNNANGTYDSIIFEGAELFVEIGIADWTQQTPTVTYIPCGYFTPDEQPRKLTTITLKALDRMTRFDAVHPTLTPWTDGNGNVITDGNGNIIYFCAELSFPCTIAQLVKQCAIRCQVPFTQSLSNLPNYNYTITALPVLQQAITFRNIIQWCAGIMGTCAYIDWNGELCFSWYDNTTSYTSSTSNRYSSDLYENAITITGVQFTDTDNDKTVYLAGTDDYALDLSGNALINADNAATILTNIYNAVHDFAYTPFSATVVCAPYLWPLDRMTFTDKDGNGHVSAITNVRFGINSNTAIASKGETAQLDSYAPVNSFTTQQQQEIAHIQRVNSTALNEAVEHATQMITGGLGGYVILKVNEVTGQTEEILIMDTPDTETAVNVWRFNQGGLGHSSNGYNGPFNDVALTADGKINANMITIGAMVADRIMGGTLTLGGNNNTNGVLQVLDASGNVIGTWNKEGVNIEKGSIDIKPVSGTGNDDIIQINGYSAPLRIKQTLSGNTFDMKVGASGIILNPDGYNISHRGTIQSTLFEIESWDQFTPQIYLKKVESGSADGSSPSISIRTDIGISLNARRNGYSEDWVKIDLEKILTRGNIVAYGSLTVSGAKNRRVSTDQYSDRLLYCYETPSPMFGDVGEGVIAEDGLCYITLDAVFAQTITTAQYQVFLQKYGDGDVWVKERKGGYFIVHGTPGLAFGWEIKAKQRDFDQKRLERAEELYYKPETTDYGAEAAQYIEQLKKEREIA